ncbi:MAG: hypothetical protein IPK03_16065 [Bacteroidetes bacterium]|nr:hypothetical protein [Bacteroidota bacterium]
MKKLFTFLLFTSTAIICRAQMPNPALIGYWHNWSDVNAPYVQLDSIDSRYNVIEVSFAIATSPTDMNMVFVPDVVSKAVFKAKVLALQSQGKRYC